MPSWLFTHIDPLPDLVVSYQTNFSHLKVSILPDENNFAITKDIFLQMDAYENKKCITSKTGLTITHVKTGHFVLRFKGIFRKKLYILHENTLYSGMKVS